MGGNEGAILQFGLVWTGSHSLTSNLNMVKRRANKRQRVVTPSEEVTVTVNLEEGWLGKFLELPTDELAKLLADIANHGKVKTATIEKARTSLKGYAKKKSATRGCFIWLRPPRHPPHAS